MEEKEPAFYITLQEFSLYSKKFKRRGFIGLLNLEGKKVVFPHEKTHKKPKKDRFEVIKQVRANLSPVFIIYPKKNTEPLSAIIKKLEKTRPFLKIRDPEGIRYKIWKLADRKQIERLSGYFQKVPLLIADGHHRFEVASRFFRSNKVKASVFRDLNYILAYFSPQDENLLVLPTHRVFRKRLDLKMFLDKLKPYFFIEKHKSFAGLEDYLVKRKLFSFGFFQDNNIFSLSLKDKAFLDRIYARDGVYKKLDAFLLHEWIFKKVLRLNIEEKDLLYAKSVKQAAKLSRIYKGCSFFTRPARIGDVMSLAFKGLRLPQKTTYFYPKFLSGPILRKLY